MTYKEKFEASEQRAHYQNIATKILRDMNDLRSKAQDSKTVPRRWIWELIQNAKDVHYNDGVDIQIEFKETRQQPKVTFSHNGKPFSADNIRFLIEQISTKDRDKDEEGKRKTTGKFGTGFLTTHLLSEIVTVHGVAKEEGLKYRKFKLILDRSGYELKEITDAVQQAKDSVINLDSMKPYENYDKDHYNTSFHYPLGDELSLGIAKAGLDDLARCLPYALLFVDEIETVHIVHTKQIYYKPKRASTGQTIEYISVFIEKENNADDAEELTFVKLTKGFTNIVIPIKRHSKKKIEILSIDNNIPRLFCDFPLIGAEIFPFPVIINNPNFNPTDPRDGVFLNSTQQRANPLVDENKDIVQDAVELYYILLGHAIENKWMNLHLLAKTTALKEIPYWVSEPWFNASVLKPIREKLLRIPIVNTADGCLTEIIDKENDCYIWFPYSNKKEIREKMWILAKDWFPYRLPEKDEVELWYKLAWEECGKLTLDLFAEFVEDDDTLEELQKGLNNISAIDWLNSFYDLLQLDDKEFHSIIDKRAIVPDQNGDFWKKSQLHKDAGDIDETFKDILKEFGNDIRAKLANPLIKNIEFERQIDQNFVVKEIANEINSKTLDREVAKNYRSALNHLLIYFRSKPENAQKLFPAIYANKHLLYDDEEILENISQAEQLNDLLKEFNVKTAQELKTLLAQNTKQKNELLPITQELLVSLGISKIKDWIDALADKDLKAMFEHNSVPTADMFVLAQSMIAKSKQRVIEHLQSLKEYDLSLMDDQTATTILSGVYKDDNLISIVFRPAYDGNVIIYYGSERAVLFHEPSELWVDDGKNVRQITLGHLLETTQIKKFPI